jgi:hypothetical protein
MTYKKKKIYLLALITALALLYTGSFVFSPERSSARSASYVWLDPKLAGRAGRIIINTGAETVEMVKKNSVWVILRDGHEYPARQMRIEDFIGFFTTRAAWPVRASSISSHEIFGLNEGTAPRVTIFGENAVLLDILIGYDDNSGHEIYLRRFTQNEVRSGDNKISSYITGLSISWYNLALIPESTTGEIDVDSVQRLSVHDGDESIIFSRRNREWVVSGSEVVDPDQNIIENYIRVVLNAEGDNFVDSIYANDPAFYHSRIVLELGNGRIVTIRFTEADETGRRLAHASGSEYVYSIPSWTVMRLFRDASSFERL